MRPLLTNRDLAAIFTLIANLLEIKGEVVFKTLAYRKAAENLEQMGQEARALWSAGQLRELPGIGKALADKIDELLRTGRLQFLDELKQAVPVTLVELLQVPDVGPKKVRLFWQAAQVTTLAELEAAARGGRLSGLAGMGPKSEAKILAGLEALKRRPSKLLLGDALPLAGELLAMLRALPGVQAAAAGGSVRRMRALVGDVDLLVAAKDAAPVLAALQAMAAWRMCWRKAAPRPAWSFTPACARSCGCIRQSALARRCNTPLAPRITMCACAKLRAQKICRCLSMH
ncbi:hypothetical protein EMGBS3_15410 [Anaerolineaceae bacterium]|nr:hypothetical protein EMGBS3_15410 [Anaerolineaceae bacterium]